MFASNDIEEVKKLVATDPVIISGEMVAQLMKSRFLAWWRRLFVPVAEKIWRIAVSSDTTVKIVLASSATRAGSAACRPSNPGVACEALFHPQRESSSGVAQSDRNGRRHSGGAGRLRL